MNMILPSNRAMLVLNYTKMQMKYLFLIFHEIWLAFMKQRLKVTKTVVLFLLLKIAFRAYFST